MFDKHYFGCPGPSCCAFTIWVYMCTFSRQKWVVPENICTPTTGGILEFQMHGGLFGLEFLMHGGGGGLLGLEFRMHEGVSSPEIPKGGRLKTLIYWFLKFGKPDWYVRVLNKLSRKGTTMKLGCAAYLELPWNACFWQLFHWSFRWFIHCLSKSAIHDTFLTAGTVNKAAVLFLIALLTATKQVLWSGRSTCDQFCNRSFPKPAPGSLVSSENLTKLGTQMAVGTRLQTNKMAGWFWIRQWKLSKE